MEQERKKLSPEGFENSSKVIYEASKSFKYTLRGYGTR